MVIFSPATPFYFSFTLGVAWGLDPYHQFFCSPFSAGSVRLPSLYWPFWIIGVLFVQVNEGCFESMKELYYNYTLSKIAYLWAVPGYELEMIQIVLC